MGLPPTAGSGLSGCESRALGVDGKGSSGAGLSLGTRDGSPRTEFIGTSGLQERDKHGAAAHAERSSRCHTKKHSFVKICQHPLVDLACSENLNGYG